MKFMLMKFLVRMKIKKMMTIEYRQLMMFQKSINPMKMKLVLNMDHLKKKMMRMISMLMILMEEYVYQREAHWNMKPVLLNISWHIDTRIHTAILA